MKTLAIFLALLGATFAPAQTTYSVEVTWSASPASTVTTPGTVTVYKAVGTCLAPGTFNILSLGGPAAGTWTDNAVTYGATYCYYVEAVINGASSAPSTTYQAVIPAQVAPPASLTGTVIKTN